MATTEIILAGVFTIIGAAINALIMKYGIPKVLGKRVFNGTGEAVSLEIKEHFEKNTSIKYSFKKAKITILTKKAHVEAKFIGQDKEGNHYSGKITGSGPFEDGIAFVTYKGILDAPNASWTGILIAKIP